MVRMVSSQQFCLFRNLTRRWASGTYFLVATHMILRFAIISHCFSLTLVFWSIWTKKYCKFVYNRFRLIRFHRILYSIEWWMTEGRMNRMNHHSDSFMWSIMNRLSLSIQFFSLGKNEKITGARLFRSPWWGQKPKTSNVWTEWTEAVSGLFLFNSLIL